MTRRLHLVNLALVALLLLAGWQLRQRWAEARERERRVLGVAPESAPAMEEQPLLAPEPPRASDYLLVAEKFLFAGFSISAAGRPSS